MANFYIQSVTVDISGLTPNSEGHISRSAGVTFPTNVIASGASLQSWKLSYPDANNHWVAVCGAGVENVQQLGNQVTFNAWLQLVDSSDNKISPPNSSIIVQVTAYAQ